MGLIIGGVILLVVIIIASLSIRTIRPTERGLVERFGKYMRYADAGIVFLIPFVESLIKVNTTEMMVSSEKREIITADSLNANVDANVYFKVKANERDVKASVYNVYDYRVQIVALAKTTLRNIIGTMTLKEANSERGKINSALYTQLSQETLNWGIEIVRTELKEIEPPKDVQEAMNQVVVANNQKTAAVDFATALETKADGERRATIKSAEGQRQSTILIAEANRQASILNAEGSRQAVILQAEGSKQAKVLVAEGDAQAIKLVNEAAEKYFTGNAQTLRKLEAVETTMKAGSKIVIPEGKSLVNVIGNLSDVK